MSKAAFSLAGKVAVVTGAGRGIGLCLTKKLLESSCSVLLADTSLTSDARALLDSTAPPLGLYKQTDVSDPAAIKKLWSFAHAEFGKTPDIVIPNAGVYEPPESGFWTMPVEAKPFKSLEINLMHPLLLAKLAVEGLVREGREGRVVLVGSIAGQIPNPLTPLYCAAKAGLNNFTRSLEMLDPEFGIKINCIAPGLIRTPLWTEHPEKLRWVDESHDTWIEPEEVADAIIDAMVNPSINGGQVIEVSKDARRMVDTYGDPGPKGRGTSVSHGKVEIEKLMKELKGLRKKGVGYVEGFT